MELSGELRDAIRGDPVTEEVAGHADLAAAAAAQNRLPELGPDLDQLLTSLIAHTCTGRVRDGCQLGGPMAAKEVRSAQAMDRVSETCVHF